LKRGLLIAAGVVALMAPACHRERESENTYLSDSFALQLTSHVDTVSGATVAPEFMLMAQPRVLRGRFLIPADYAKEAIPVVVLSHDLWVRRFGSDPRIIGAKVRVNGQELTVVGVAAANFATPRGALLWVPGRP
jgi:hypothetical protein